MSIADEITRIQNAKASIKTAIENKGVTVGEGTIDTYASKIDEITVGEGGGSSDSGLITEEELAYYKEIEASFLSRINLDYGANTTVLPKGITRLENYAFYGCNKLALTSLPDTIERIGSFVFYNCTNFVITKTPSACTMIGTNAFRGCSSITKLDIVSEDFYSLGGYSLNNCADLQTLIIRATSVPSLLGSALVGTLIESGTGYIYVLDDLVDSYKSATNWSTYADQIKPISELPTEEA